MTIIDIVLYISLTFLFGFICGDISLRNKLNKHNENKKTEDYAKRWY
jgi:hypothetical protein